MEFGFVIVVAVAWMVINAVREASRRMPGGQGPGSWDPLPPGRAQGRKRLELPESFADTSPGLRGLLEAIENARARAEGAPAPRKPPMPTPAHRPAQHPVLRRAPAPAPELGSEVVGSEVFEDARPVRRQREEVDLDQESAEVARRRREAVARREAPRTAADHAAFDSRIRREPADATAVAVPAPPGAIDLRQALVWREILSPPKSLRDD